MNKRNPYSKEKHEGQGSGAEWGGGGKWRRRGLGRIKASAL